MKTVFTFFIILISVLCMSTSSCDSRPDNTSALDEQAATEVNQRRLLANQPPPTLDWSLERDNLIKRSLLQNDRAVMFYMYVFVPGIADPIGYYQINKVSSVNSMLTNTEQIVNAASSGIDRYVLPSPAEDGSYGSNGDGVFGFTPEDVYIEHNLLYMCATVPLSFTKPVNRLMIIDVKTQNDLKILMDRINGRAKEAPQVITKTEEVQIK